jgi:hypothetical protein
MNEPARPRTCLLGRLDASAPPKKKPAGFAIFTGRRRASYRNPSSIFARKLYLALFIAFIIRLYTILKFWEGINTASRNSKLDLREAKVYLWESSANL